VKVFFSGGPRDGQWCDMERTPREWHVPVLPPLPDCTFTGYFADPNISYRTASVRRAVYRLQEKPQFMYVYDKTL